MKLGIKVEVSRESTANRRFEEFALCHMPLVSVVIPTLRRPQLLLRALKSVFDQTHKNIEVIVVVDGPDPETTTVVRSISDTRLRVIVNPKSLTAAGARNIGAANAVGDWIAFLDDDDEWLPQKLERQLAFAGNRGFALITCQSRLVTPYSKDVVAPDLIYDNRVPLDEYLFDRRSLLSWPGFIQTSSYLIPRDLFNSAPFKVDNPHDDWDFILTLSKRLGVRIETLPEVLTIIHIDHPRPSLSHRGTWTGSLIWIDSIRSIITKRAYSGFCLSVVGPRAARDRAYSAFILLFYQAFRYGSPRRWQVLSFLSLWFLSQSTRRQLRLFLRRETPPPTTRSSIRVNH
jgi:glycosyltransferase involved in cell wall biosynthesis